MDANQRPAFGAILRTLVDAEEVSIRVSFLIVVFRNVQNCFFFFFCAM